MRLLLIICLKGCTAYKVSVFEVILVRIFPGFSRIWTEYGERRSISLYSVRIWKNAGKMRTRITPNTDSFYAVMFVSYLFVSAIICLVLKRFMSLFS